MNGTGIRLRELNFELLKAVLKVYPGGVTKQFLAEKTGLSLATCGTLVTELVKTGRIDYMMSEVGKGKACWDCHRDVPHGGKNSLSSTPAAIVPLPDSPVPEWLRKMKE